MLFEHLATGCKDSRVSDHVLMEQQGQLDNYMFCTECQSIRTRSEAFRAVDLVVRGSPSLQASFDAYTHPEKMEGANAVECAKCDKRTTQLKGCRFARLPLYLTLQLRRFDMNWDTLQRVKVSDAIAFPKNLNMDGHMGPSSEDLSKAASQGGWCKVGVHKEPIVLTHMHTLVSHRYCRCSPVF